MWFQLVQAALRLGIRLGVGVQHRQVAAVFEGAQDAALLRRRIVQQGQRRVAVGGDHHLVEALHVAGDVAHLRAAGDALARRSPARRCGPRPVKAARQLADIGAAAALDRAPQAAAEDAHHAVVLEEADQGRGRIGADRRQRRRPDRRGLRQQVVVAERLAVALLGQVVVERGQRRLQRGQVLRPVPVEPHHVAQHAPRTGRRRCSASGRTCRSGRSWNIRTRRRPG